MCTNKCLVRDDPTSVDCKACDEYSLPLNSLVKPEIVCICGSSRFTDAIKSARINETLAGNIVLSVELLEGAELNRSTRKLLDEIHRRKIDMSSEILVINVGNYIGESTQGEIDYALAQGKRVRYLESA
jgi:hypothetical protein